MLAQERALQAAMLASDVDRLGRLLHDDLLAVGPDGQLADKAVDLQAHRTGVFRNAALTEEEVRVNVVGDTALTFVVLAIRGTIDGTDVSGRYRYSRTWTRATAPGKLSGRTSARQGEPYGGAAPRCRCRRDDSAVCQGRPTRSSVVQRDSDPRGRSGFRKSRIAILPSESPRPLPTGGSSRLASINCR